MEGQDESQPSIESRMLAILQNQKGDIVNPEPDATPEKERGIDVAEGLREKKPELPVQEEEEEQPEEDSETPTEEVQEITKYRFTVKNADGLDEEVEMTPEEMQKSVMLERDYRRKTTELARQREQLQTEISKGLEQERAQYLQNLEVVKNAFLKSLAPEFESVDLNKLADEDPAQYVKVTNRLGQVQKIWQAIQEEQAKVTQQLQAEHQQAMQKAVIEARETLQKAIPTWSDELYENVLKTTVDSYGFKPEEVNVVVDPRIIRLMHDAAEYRKLKGQSSIVQKKVAQAPKVVKPGQGGQRVDPTHEARAALRKSGKTDDFAAFLQAKFAKGK